MTVEAVTVSGEVLVAGSAEYESARRSQIARFDGVRPGAVVRCRVPEDVAQALAFASQAVVRDPQGATLTLTQPPGAA
jgi:hypothetical protein